MREVTETLYDHNSDIIALFEKHSKYYYELPKFKALHEHLNLWIDKYNDPLKEQKKQCPVYRGGPFH